MPEHSEETALQAPLADLPYVINGSLSQPRERDVYPIEGKAGEPLHISTLSAQLGGPYLDTVLTLRDAAGNKLAENDDVVAGWGGLLGNPDSRVFYTSKQDGRLLVEVRDRLNRGGATFPYRVKVDRATPGFQLFTTPENVTVRRGGAVVTTDPYLGAAGHLVALRDGDLAYLHVHPLDEEPSGPVRFAIETPSAGTYALFFDFQIDGKVHTARFVIDATTAPTPAGHDDGSAH